MALVPSVLRSQVCRCSPDVDSIRGAGCLGSGELCGGDLSCGGLCGCDMIYVRPPRNALAVPTNALPRYPPLGLAIHPASFLCSTSGELFGRDCVIAALAIGQCA